MIEAARWSRPLLVATLSMVLAGCGLYEQPVALDLPASPIQRALSSCRPKTEKAETACVRQALVDGHAGPQAIAAMMPGCRVGRVCSLEYRTREREGQIGLLRAYASDYVADWRVTIDLTSPGRGAAEVPIRVLQV